MWATLQPDLFSRLPNHIGNGNNPMRAATADDLSRQADWQARLDQLDALRNYGEDWDGQGAEAPAAALLDSAAALLNVLRQANIEPPECVVPGVNGTIVLEWHGAGQKYLEIEITAPGEADGVLIVPGQQTEHWKL